MHKSPSFPLSEKGKRLIHHSYRNQSLPFVKGVPNLRGTSFANDRVEGRDLFLNAFCWHDL